MKKMIVILNPKSGSSGEDFKAEIEKALNTRGIEYSLLETTLAISGGELARKAFEEGATHDYVGRQRSGAPACRIHTW